MIDIKNILFALLAGLFIGGCAGFYAKGKFSQADQVEAVVEQRKEDVSAAKEMRKDEAVLQTEIRATRRTIETTRSEVKKHEITTQQVLDRHEGPVDCRNAVLGGDLVGLLNAARDDADVAPAAGSDGESAAAAETEVERHRR